VNEPQPGEGAGAGNQKLAYAAPRLQLFGALSALTAAVGKNGTVFDGGNMANMNKTS
jgi:hypothetical protein